jgi:hypothetical protein
MKISRLKSRILLLTPKRPQIARLGEREKKGAEPPWAGQDRDEQDMSGRTEMSRLP